MERFIAAENIKRFKRQLESCTDEAQRAQIEQLLVSEEAKLRMLLVSPESRLV